MTITKFLTKLKFHSAPGYKVSLLDVCNNEVMCVKSVNKSMWCIAEAWRKENCSLPIRKFLFIFILSYDFEY